MEYEIIKSIKQLEKYRDSYDQFIASSADNEYQYYAYGYLASLADFLQRNTQICIILVFRDGRLSAVAPFHIRKRHYIYLSNRYLQLLGAGTHPLASKYGAIIYAQNIDRAAVDKVIFNSLYSDKMPGWDEIQLDNLKSDSATVPLSRYFNYSQSAITSCYRTPTNYTENDFLYAFFKRKSRYKLTRAKKALYNDYKKVEFIKSLTFDNDTFESIARIHSQRQKYKCENSEFKDYYSLFDDKFDRNSLLKLTQWLAEHNRLSLYLLKADDNIIAFLYCIDFNRISNAILMAFDVNYQEYSPSKLLALYAIEACNKDKSCEQIDFLEDNNLFKQQFCPVEIKRSSFHAINNASIASRLKWFYIKNLKRLRS